MPLDFLIWLYDNKNILDPIHIADMTYWYKTMYSLSNVHEKNYVLLRLFILMA